MRNLYILLFFSFLSISAYAQTNAQTILNGFLLPYEGGVFRGFAFDNNEDDIDEAERERSNVTFAYDEFGEDLSYYVGYDVELQGENNYAYIDYGLDVYGLFEVIAAIYLENDALALDCYNALLKYYTDKLGAGTKDEDGYIGFYGTFNGDPYQVWLILDSDEYGKFVAYELYYDGPY